MHPAFSVIFFTTASGAGYGLITLMAILQASGLLPPDPQVGWVGFGIGFTLITIGLLTSTFHLGHPERAWRAISQWRSSWLSREGVFAILAYIPTGAYAIGWIFLDWRDDLFILTGMVGAMLCMQTVHCTAMIYASLKTIRAWSNGWTAIVYFSISIFTGALLVNAIASVFGYWHPTMFWITTGSIAVAGVAKMQYWRFIDRNPSESTAETATGIKGHIRLLESPHTQENYLQKEMGYKIARKHAAKLRQLAIAAGFVAPVLLITLANTSVPATAAALSVLAVPVAAIGVLIERWLFFAEAKHVVTLYYGETTA
jgi:sulfite dehydrogenase (quinone) subunit SoeC